MSAYDRKISSEVFKHLTSLSSYKEELNKYLKDFMVFGEEAGFLECIWDDQKEDVVIRYNRHPDFDTIVTSERDTHKFIYRFIPWGLFNLGFYSTLDLSADGNAYYRVDMGIYLPFFHLHILFRKKH